MLSAFIVFSEPIVDLSTRSLSELSRGLYVAKESGPWNARGWSIGKREVIERFCINRPY